MPVRQALEPENAELWVIDMQDKLMPLIAGHEAVTFNSVTMIRAARLLGLPIVCTEHYPRGLGRTAAPVREAIGDGAERFEKTIFSCCGPEAVRQHLAGSGRRQIVTVGIETHICVQQTALELLRLGFQPYVCADAVGSRHELDYDVALLRMQQAGAVVTTAEAAIYELMHDTGHPAFKQVIELIKTADRERPG